MKNIVFELFLAQNNLLFINTSEKCFFRSQRSFGGILFSANTATDISRILFSRERICNLLLLLKNVVFCLRLIESNPDLYFIN